MEKRFKITTTEENIKFVVPTLEKLGGVNVFGYGKFRDLVIGEAYYVNNIGNAICQDYFQDDGEFQELNTSEYVDDFDPDKELNDRIKELSECLRELITINEKYWSITEGDYTIQLDKAVSKSIEVLNKEK